MTAEDVYALLLKYAGSLNNKKYSSAEDLVHEAYIETNEFYDVQLLKKAITKIAYKDQSKHLEAQSEYIDKIENKLRRCPECDTDYPLYAFYNSRPELGVIGLNRLCKKCHNVQKWQRIKIDPDRKKKAYDKQRRYYNKNKVLLNRKRNEKRKEERVNKRKYIRKTNGKSIVGFNRNGKPCIGFNSIREADKHGFNSSCISECLKGKRLWHKNHLWFYGDFALYTP